MSHACSWLLLPIFRLNHSLGLYFSVFYSKFKMHSIFQSRIYIIGLDNIFDRRNRDVVRTSHWQLLTHKVIDKSNITKPIWPIIILLPFMKNYIFYGSKIKIHSIKKKSRRNRRNVNSKISKGLCRNMHSLRSLHTSVIS